MDSPTIRILHTNDLHGAMVEWRARSLGPIRDKCDLYFDSGDCIKAGNLAIPIRPDPVWQFLTDLRCTASVPGNRESHLLAPAFDAKLAASGHPVLCCNLFDKSGNRVLPPSANFEVHGVRIGVLGAMVPMVTERMAAKSVSHFIWSAPIPEAAQVAKQLRDTCDLVVALTHIGLKQDQLLAEASPDIDLILGGHSHSVLDSPARVRKTWICQGGSHGKYFGVYGWQMGAGLVEANLHDWAALSAHN
jgi:5'-nucleotidase